MHFAPIERLTSKKWNVDPEMFIDQSFCLATHLPISGGTNEFNSISTPAVDAIAVDAFCAIGISAWKRLFEWNQCDWRAARWIEWRLLKWGRNQSVETNLTESPLLGFFMLKKATDRAKGKHHSHSSLWNDPIICNLLFSLQFKQTCVFDFVRFVRCF